MRTRTLLVLTVVLLALAAASPAHGAVLFAVDDDNQLHRFSSTAPGSGTALNITGLQAGETIVGIDFRPQINQLYGVGNTAGTGRLYLINAFTGAATQVGPTTTLTGTSFGVDFNPVPDRLRVVSDADQNLRINPDNGMVTVDAPLHYAIGDPNQGDNPNVVASAYTNNFAGATTTTLYAIDTGQNAVVMQNPPNDGLLSTVAPLSITAPTLSGFEVLDSGEAFVTTTGSSTSAVFTINPVTGTMTALGTVNDVLVGLTGEPTGAAGPFSGIVNRGPESNQLDLMVRNDGQRPIEFLSGELASGFTPVSADIVSGPDAICTPFPAQGEVSCGPFGAPGYWGPGQELVIRIGTDPRYPDNGGIAFFACAARCFRDAGPFSFGGPAAVVPPGGETPPGGGLPGGGDFDLDGDVDLSDLTTLLGAQLGADGVTIRLETPAGVAEGEQLVFLTELLANFGRASAAQRGRAKQTVIARRRASLRGGERKRVRIPLTRAGRRLYRGYTRKRLRTTLRLTVTYRPASGAAQKRTFRRKLNLRVKPPRR